MKTTFITDINKIKFEVNTEVARLAFAGELDEKANEIPYKLIPGRTPHYRCCVYREREIIRERVQLAMGRSAMSGQKNKNIVQVIEAACEGCPINRFKTKVYLYIRLIIRFFKADTISIRHKRLF